MKLVAPRGCALSLLEHFQNKVLSSLVWPESWPSFEQDIGLETPLMSLPTWVMIVIPVINSQAASALLTSMMTILIYICLGSGLKFVGNHPRINNKIRLCFAWIIRWYEEVLKGLFMVYFYQRSANKIYCILVEATERFERIFDKCYLYVQSWLYLWY